MPRARAVRAAPSYPGNCCTRQRKGRRSERLFEKFYLAGLSQLEGIRRESQTDWCPSQPLLGLREYAVGSRVCHEPHLVGVGPEVGVAQSRQSLRRAGYSTAVRESRRTSDKPLPAMCKQPTFTPPAKPTPQIYRALRAGGAMVMPPLCSQYLLRTICGHTAASSSSPDNSPGRGRSP
jgi:hypothetical protein